MPNPRPPSHTPPSSRVGGLDLAALFALSLGLHLLYLWQISSNPFFESPVVDAQTYHERALAIAAGTWWEEDVFWQPPLYPYLLGLWYSLWGGPAFVATRVLQAILGASTVVLTTTWTGRLFSRGAALTSGLLLTFYGPLLFFDGELLSPVLTLFLNAVGLLLLTPPPPGEMTPGRWASAGFVFGLSALSRPDITLVVAGVVVLQLWRRQWRSVIPFLALFVLSTTPATWHNHHFGGEWVWISSNSGVNFYLGNSENYDQTVGIRPGVAWRDLMRRPINDGVDPHNSSAQSQWWTRHTLAIIADDPGRWAMTVLKKAVLLVGAPEVYRNLDLHFFSRWAPLLPRLPGWGLLFPLALLGARVCQRRGGIPPIIVVWVGSYTAAILLYFVAGRYRLPLVPVLSGLGGVTLAWVWENRHQLRTHLTPLLVTAGVGVIIQVDPYHAGAMYEAEGYNLLGKAQAARENYPSALDSFQQASALDPSYIDPLFNQGRTLQMMGKAVEAIPFYVKVLEHFSQDTETLNNLGVCHLSVGHVEEGLALLRPLLQDPLANGDLAFNVAQGEVSRGALEEALRVLTSFSQGSSPRAGQLKQELTQVLESRPALFSALATPAPPSSGPTPAQKQANNQAHQAIAAGNPLRGELLLQPVLMENPGYAVGWLNLGQAWLGLGENDAAGQAFMRVMELDPRHSSALLGLAYSLKSRGRDQELKEVLRHFLEVAPLHPRADDARQMLLELEPK